MIALPDDPSVEARGWAFWELGGKFAWIGDRHTNFFDGSVCAFSPTQDAAWSPGGDLRTLLDLYSVWALRQLHLEVFDRWAGRQYALLDRTGTPLPYYRLVEFKDEELCSCDSGNRYAQCCKPSDLRVNFIAAKRQFEAINNGRNIRDRHPPEAVVASAKGHSLPPMVTVHETLSQMHSAGGRS